MGKAGAAVSIAIAIVAIIVIAYYTNIFEIAKPQVEKSINFTKEEASKVQGKDVVSGAETVSSTVQNITSQIKIKNPLP